MTTYDEATKLKAEGQAHLRMSQELAEAAELALELAMPERAQALIDLAKDEASQSQRLVEAAIRA